MLSKPLSNLASWISHFSRQEMPILQSSLEQMRLLHDKLDDVGIRDITGLIRHDPLLSLRLLRYQESHRHASQVTDVTTLDHILLMIGLGGFFRTFGNSLTIETKLAAHPQALDGCKRVCSRAYLAARLAEAIAIRRHDLDPNEITTTVLLHNTAEIILWAEAPTLATEIASLLHDTPGMRSRDAQQQVLGITLHELHLGLIQAWHFPSLMRHLLDERFANEPRVQTISVATSIARHLSSSWADPGLPDDYEIVGRLISGTPEEAYRIVQKVVLSVAREWHWYGITPVATTLPQETT